jgi:hypothetical protein
MRKLFESQLTSIFNLCEEAESGEPIISAKDMDDLVNSGQATSKIVSEWGTIDNSSYMRQMGENVYVRKDNPFALMSGKELMEGEDDDSYYWVLKKTVRTDASSGSGNGAG